MTLELCHAIASALLVANPKGVWKHAWGNGGRYLVIATVLFSVAIGILGTVVATQIIQFGAISL